MRVFSYYLFSSVLGGLTLRTVTSPFPTDAAAREHECSGTFVQERREEKKVFDECDPAWRHLFCYGDLETRV